MVNKGLPVSRCRVRGNTGTRGGGVGVNGGVCVCKIAVQLPLTLI